MKPMILKFERESEEKTILSMDEALSELNGYWNKIKYQLLNGDLLWTPYSSYQLITKVMIEESFIDDEIRVTNRMDKNGDILHPGIVLWRCKFDPFKELPNGELDYYASRKIAERQVEAYKKLNDKQFEILIKRNHDKAKN